MADRTQRLAIVVTAQDLASGKLGLVRKELAGMGTAGKLSALGLGTGIAAVRKGEQAVKHLGERVSSLAGPLGFIGLTAGAFGIAGALEQGIEKAQTMAYAVEKLTGVTGLGVHAASQLIAVFGRFGIEGDKVSTMAGFAEKTLGKLAAGVGSASGGVSKLTKFEQLYGISLHDNAGKAVDYATELNRVADYYQSNATAGQKAAVAATLFGKNYVALIPVLKLGSKGIAEIAAEADNLGLTLRTAEDVSNVQNFVKAQRDAKEAIGGIEVQLGLLVMPDLTGGFRTLTKYLSTHRAEVQQFFRDGLKVAEGLAAFVTGTLIPAVQSVAGVFIAGWNAIPQPFRDLLVKGLVADRTVKFLFGFSPAHMIVDGLETGISKGLGSILGSVFGKGIVQPVFVTNPGFGAGGGGGTLLGGAGSLLQKAAGAGLAFVGSNVMTGGVQAGGPAGAAQAAGGGAAMIAGGALIAGPLGAMVGSLAAVGQTLIDIRQQNADQGNGIATSVAAQIGGGAKLGDLQQSLAAVDQGINDIQANPLNVLLAGDALDSLHAQHNALEAQIGIATDTRSEAAGTRMAAEASAAATSRIPPILDALHQSFKTDFDRLIHATKPVDVAAFARKVGGEVSHGVGNLKTTNHVLEVLKAKLDDTHDPKTEAVLRAQIKAVERKVVGREYVQRQINEARKVAASSESIKQKTADLKVIQRNLLARGDIHAAAEVEHLITINATTSGLPPRIGAAIGGIVINAGDTRSEAHGTAASQPAGGTTSSSSSTNQRGTRADGGMAYPGRIYRVNERRGEFFEPVVPTRIHSNAPGLMAAGAARAVMVQLALSVHIAPQWTIGVRNIAAKTKSDLRYGKLNAG